MITGLVLIITGLLVGLMSSFFGLGGGVLIVPSLTSLFPTMEARGIIGVSLGVISLNSILNIFIYKKIKLIPEKLEIVSIFLGCLFGALIGGQLLSIFDQKTIKLIFAVSLILAILKNIVSTNNAGYSQDEYSKVLLFFIAFGGSILSAVSGLGGGIIFVPLFINILKIPTRKIPSYSNIAMFFACTIGFIPHLLVDKTQGPISETIGFGQFGRIDFFAVLIIFIGTSLSSRFGARINMTIKASNKVIVLNTVLVILAIKMIIEI